MSYRRHKRRKVKTPRRRRKSVSQSQRVTQKVTQKVSVTVNPLAQRGARRRRSYRGKQHIVHQGSYPGLPPRLVFSLPSQGAAEMTNIRDRIKNLEIQGLPQRGGVHNPPGALPQARPPPNVPRPPPGVPQQQHPFTPAAVQQKLNQTLGELTELRRRFDDVKQIYGAGSPNPPPRGSALTGGRRRNANQQARAEAYGDPAIAARAIHGGGGTNLRSRYIGTPPSNVG